MTDNAIIASTVRPVDVQPQSYTLQLNGGTEAIVTAARPRPLDVLLEAHTITIGPSVETVVNIGAPRKVVSLLQFGTPGQDGAPGVDADQVELRVSGDMLQWRRVGQVAWNDLVDLTTVMPGSLWGLIGGTLSNQTDLQAALDGKEAAGAAAAAMAAHLLTGDPHPQYLTPSEGNAAYSLLGHTHVLANLTDVTVTAANLNALDDGADTTLHFHAADRARANHTGTQLASTISDFPEAVDDRVAALLVAGANVTINYDDTANTLTIAASGGGGGGLSDGDKGDITVSAAGTVWTIDNNVVSYAKLQDVAANSVLARAANSSGDVSEVALAASQLLGRGATGDVAAITLGTGLLMSGTTLEASGGSGIWVAESRTDYSTYVTPTVTTAFGEDNTVPQNTEGYEVFTHTHTPLNAGHKLKIEAVLYGMNNGFNTMRAALFKDSDASALAAASGAMGRTYAGMGSVRLCHVMDAGTTSPITFKLRGSPEANGLVLYVNGTEAGARYGGTVKSFISVTEYDPLAEFSGTENMPAGTYGDISVPSSGVMRVVLADDAPSTPAADTVRLFRREIANRQMPAFIGPAGLDSALQPFIARNKVGYWAPPGNGTTVPGVLGFTAPTITGFTATARNVATTNMFTRMRRLGYVTAATAAAVGQWRCAAAQFTVGDPTTQLGGFHYIVRFGISDAAAVSDARMFMGIGSSITPTNVEPSTLKQRIGVGHGASDTNMKLFYGGSAAQAPIDLGANFPANTRDTDVYELALFSPPNSGDVHWQVTRLNTGHIASGTITNSGSAVLPTNTTLLTPWGYRTNNATALAVGLDVMSAYIETDQ